MTDAGPGQRPGDQRDEDRFLAAMLRSSAEAIIGVTLDGTVTAWSLGAERQLGYRAGEILGHSTSELVPPGGTPELPALREKLARGEPVSRYQSHVLRKDGTVIEVVKALWPVWDGGAVVGAAALSLAPTREDRLRSRLAAIVESSTDAIIGLDLAGKITSWNHAAEQMSGYPAAEMTGRSVLELLVPGDQHDLGALSARLRQGEQVQNYYSQARRKDGSIMHCLTAMSAVRDADGAMTGMSLVVADITDQVRTRALREAAEERQRRAERIETVSQLAGRIAHDFNNLLSAIMGYGGLIADAAADLPGVRADTEQVLDAARRASRLSRDLLLISREEPARTEALDLSGLLAQLRGLLASSVGEHITLRFATAAVPPVLADPGRMEQVVLNLAVNARDAMPGGGTLTFTTAVAAGKEPPAGPDDGTYVELAVSDTGSGMSAEVARQAFEPFFTTKPADEGTGLGLSTVHSLVADAGGSITVESAEGHGTTFRIRLPAAAPAAAADAADGTRPGRGHGEQVLVVDDEPAVLDVTARTLERGGYTTLRAGTAGEALSLLSAHDVELMVADSVMPGMQGATLATRARELKPAVRILHMSGYRPPGRSGQPAAFLPKPFTAEALLGKVREVLDAPPADGRG